MRKILVVTSILSFLGHAWAGPVEMAHMSSDSQLMMNHSIYHQEGSVEQRKAAQKELQGQPEQAPERSKGVIETLKGHAQRVIDKIRGRGTAGAPAKSEPVSAPGVEQGGLKVDGASSSGFAKVREHAQRLWNKFTGRSEATFVANKGGDSLQQETHPSEEGQSEEQSNLNVQKGQPETATQSLQETKTVQNLQTKYQDGLFAIQNSGSAGDVGNSTTLIESKNISQESVSKGFADLQKDVKSLHKLRSTLGENGFNQLSKKFVQRYADLRFASEIHKYPMPESVDMAKLHEAVMDLSLDGTDVLQSVYESRMQMLDKAYNDTQETRSRVRAQRESANMANDEAKERALANRVNMFEQRESGLATTQLRREFNSRDGSAFGDAERLDESLRNSKSQSPGAEAGAKKSLKKNDQNKKVVALPTEDGDDFFESATQRVLDQNANNPQRIVARGGDQDLKASQSQFQDTLHAVEAWGTSQQAVQLQQQQDNRLNAKWQVRDAVQASD